MEWSGEEEEEIFFGEVTSLELRINQRIGRRKTLKLHSEEKINFYVILIQSWIRGIIQRREYKCMKTSVLRLEKFWLGMKSILKSQRKIKLNFSKWKSILNSFQVLYKRKFQKRQSCSRIIQSLWRGFQARRQYVTIRNSVLFMQNKRRSQLQRRYYLKLMKSVIVIQNQFRKKLQKNQEILKKRKILEGIREKKLLLQAKLEQNEKQKQIEAPDDLSMNGFERKRESSDESQSLSKVPKIEFEEDFSEASENSLDIETPNAIRVTRRTSILPPPISNRSIKVTPISSIRSKSQINKKPLVEKPNFDLMRLTQENTQNNRGYIKPLILNYVPVSEPRQRSGYPFTPTDRSDWNIFDPKPEGIKGVRWRQDLEEFLSTKKSITKKLASKSSLKRKDSNKENLSTTLTDSPVIIQKFVHEPIQIEKQVSTTPTLSNPSIASSRRKAQSQKIQK